MHMLIWHNISRRRAQSVLTIAITILTILTFVMVLGIFLLARKGIGLSQQRLGADALVVSTGVTVDGEDLLFSAVPENVYMSNEILDQVRQMDGVAAATPQFYSQTLEGSCCDLGKETRIVGFDPESDFILEPYFSEKSYEQLQDDEIILGGGILGDSWDPGFLFWPMDSEWWASSTPLEAAWTIPFS